MAYKRNAMGGMYWEASPTDTQSQVRTAANQWQTKTNAPNAGVAAQAQQSQRAESAGVPAIEPIIKTVTKTSTPTDDAPKSSPAVQALAGGDNLTPEDNAAKYMFAGPSTGRQGMGQRARPSLAALLASSKAY